MGYLIPGGRIRRFGDSLIAGDTAELVKVPSVKPITGSSITNTQSRIARMKSATTAADISRTAPTFNDPRYTFTTLSIPTDLRTLNGLYRFFDDTDPVVGNALRLHVEFPLSRVSMKTHSDPVIQAHFEEMWNRVNMEKLLFDVALEYWRIGNVFPYGAWNVSDMMWDQFVVLNPDYVTVEGTYLNKKPYIKLQPDEHLKKVVTTGQPKFLYDQLPQEIIKYIRMGQEIPLSPQNVFHVSHNKAPYETLGRSIIKRILKSLIYEDRMSMANFAIATRQTIPITVVKIGDPASGWVPADTELEEVRELLSAREVDPNFCYDEETECLTDQGWIKYPDLTYDHKIASFNPNGNKLEYHHPQAITIQDYDDDMIHFKTRKIDCKVTPNHRMWVKRDEKWQVVFAQDVVETDILRTCVDTYESTPLPDDLTIAGQKVSTGDFFEFIGWYISEGSISGGAYNGIRNYRVQITQTQNGSFDAVEKLMQKLPWDYVLHQDCQFTINNRKLGDYLVENFGKGSNKKKLPRWVLDAPPELLERMFTSYIEGDGTAIKTKSGVLYQAYTVSEDLADDLQEIGIKLGYSVSLTSRENSFKWGGEKIPGTLRDGERHYTRANGEKYHDIYRLNFSVDEVSRFPSLKRRKDYDTPLKQEPVLVGEVTRKGKRVDWAKIDLPSILGQTDGYAPQVADLLGCSVGTVLNQMKQLGIPPKKVGTRTSRYEDTGNIQRVPYKGKIWCVSVPSGIFVTRRHGCPTVAGNTIVYHWGIDIQFYGAAGKIWNLTNEFNRIMKWKLLGLGISEAILTGAGSYASAYAQLEVLRQRYLHFQNTLQTFVYQGIFEPVAKQCGFYKTQDTVAGKYYQGKKYGSPDNHIAKTEEMLRSHSREHHNPDSYSFVTSLMRKQAATDEMISLEYPEMDWDLLSLSNDVQYRNFLMNFDRLFPGQRKVSDATFYAAAKIDKNSEREKISREHSENLEDQLERAEITKEYQKKFADKGIPFPGDPKQGPPGG
ncbi:MAG: hypothetical protein ACTSV7_12200, partial [Candidatus Baldrarchaeia archaeon]